MNKSKNLFINYDLDNPVSMNFDNYQINLSEGIFKTYPLEKTREYVKCLLYLDDDQITIIDGSGNNKAAKRILIRYNNSEDNREKVSRAFMLCGFELSREMVRGMYVEQMYIPLYLDNVTEIVRKYKYITHVTPSYNKEKILKNGFEPRSNNPMFNYQSKVFFFKGDTPIVEIIYQAYQFDTANNNKTNNHVYTIFAVDPNKIPDDVKFELDTNYSNGIYTLSNIPASAIIQHKDVDVVNSLKQFLN